MNKHYAMTANHHPVAPAPVCAASIRGGVRGITILRVVTVLTGAGVLALANLPVANSGIAQSAVIDIWQLHLQADIGGMPIRSVTDPV